jgi:dephospho-CoA kinase
MADLLVALTGGIASGKSTVATVFEQLGATVFDSDQIARDVVEPGTVGLEQLLDQFGSEILTNGELDRAKLAEIVFADENQRMKLEAILHPLIQAESKYRFDDSDGIVIYQIPLLVESASNYQFDKVITVEASEETRVARLLKTRSMSTLEAKGRISAQTDRSTREKIADYVIDSDCDIEQLASQAEQIWDSLIEIRNANLGFS